MTGESNPKSGSQQGSRRLLTVILGLMALIEAVFLFLDRWETTAEHLGIPSLKHVTQIVTGKPPALNMFNPEVYSGMEAIEILESPQPLPPGCSESARLGTFLRPEALGEAPPADNLAWRSYTPFYILPDSPTTIDGLKIGPQEGATSTVTLSFIVSNSGRYGSVVMDNLDLEVERTGAVDPSQVEIVATWVRSRATPVPPPPTGVGGLLLQGGVTTASGKVTAALQETGSTELNFELKEDEKVYLLTRLTLAEPGLYSVTPLVRAYDSEGNPFHEYGPSMPFAWTRLSSGPFGVQELIPSHSPECGG